MPLGDSFFAQGYTGVSMLVDDVQLLTNYANSSAFRCTLFLATPRLMTE